MQKNRVKCVFKRNELGGLFGAYPILENDSYLKLFLNTISVDEEIKSIRVVVDNKVYEMHTDKHKNLIYREYEKT